MPAHARWLTAWLISLVCAFLASSPGHADANAFGARGCAWGGKGEHDKAIADFTEAIRLDTKDALAYEHRGQAWAAKGDQEKAAADQRQAELLRRKP